MFPPNLQKNIQELERQISLLETECEHMEKEKQETTLAGKPNPKAMVRELPNQPFITGPSACVSSYSPKLLNLQPPIPKMYSSSCAHFRKSPEKFPRATTPKGPEEKRGNRGVTFNESESPEKTEEMVCGEPISKPTLPVGGFRDEKTNALEKKEPTADQQPTANPDRDNKKPCKRSIDSIKEVSESSEENYTPQVAMCKPKPKNDSKEMQAKEQTWCELIREQSPPSKWQERNPNKKNAGVRTCNFSEPKLSSDEECKRELNNVKSKSFSGNWLNELDCQASQGSKLLCKRRLRSARTKKNCDEIPMDLNMTKALLEKEIQCMLWSEEREKDEFLSGLNDSIRILQYLIGELKTKLSRERRDDVINDMQNTLMKLSGIKFQKPPLSLTSLQETNFKIMENEENIFDVKHTLLALKQFCQELSEEKTALTEEVDAKTRAIVSFKSKEKEYLSLISSLKFNLEKMKEEADEGTHARRDLKVLRVKLQEETKVIEALKKSHEKMQELVENYVLENDKLKAQVKIANLESQKFTVLLAGKEAEINKYRKELESFQKQITQQLSLLRSKATENEVEQTIEAINNHPNIIQVETFRSQMGPGVSFNDNLEDNATMESSTAITQQKNSTKAMSPEKRDMNSKQGWEIRSNSTGEGSKPAEEKSKNGDFPSNEEDEVQPAKRKYGLERVLSSSKNLRSSINELLDDIRRESSDMYWFSQSNSCVTSSQSAMISTSSGEVSEGEQQNN